MVSTFEKYLYILFFFYQVAFQGHWVSNPLASEVNSILRFFSTKWSLNKKVNRDKIIADISTDINDVTRI